MERLGVLFDPRFWIRNYPVSHEWSDYLTMLMDEVEDGRLKIEVLSEYVAKIGRVEIWIANWTESFGQRYGSGLSSLPTRKVAIRLRRLIEVHDLYAWETTDDA